MRGMGDDELDELERLAAAATPGPWVPGADEMEIRGPRGRMPDRPDLADDPRFKEQVIGGCGCCGSPFGDNPEADRPFIIAARDAIPRLVAEVRRLRDAHESEWYGAPLTREERAEDARRAAAKNPSPHRP